MSSSNNSYTANVSNYTGGDFRNLEQEYITNSGGRIRRAQPADEISVSSELNSNAISHHRSGNNDIVRRPNGMQEGFGPALIPGGLRMNIPGVSALDSIDQPTVEIKQTIRTEYRIKKNGIVYTGAVNETNIWGSHQYPQN